VFSVILVASVIKKKNRHEIPHAQQEHDVGATAVPKQVSHEL
jgi:hypothetical protein